MYIIRNKIRVICSKSRVGMEGGPFSIGGSIFHRGVYSPIEYGPRVHIQGGGSIFNMTPAFDIKPGGASSMHIDIVLQWQVSHYCGAHKHMS